MGQLRKRGNVWRIQRSLPSTREKAPSRPAWPTIRSPSRAKSSTRRPTPSERAFTDFERLISHRFMETARGYQSKVAEIREISANIERTYKRLKLLAEGGQLKKRRPHADITVTLAPLTVDEALDALLKTAPPPKGHVPTGGVPQRGVPKGGVPKGGAPHGERRPSGAPKGERRPSAQRANQRKGR